MTQGSALSLQNAHRIVFNKQKRQKLTASVLTYILLFQTIAGVFMPLNIFKPFDEPLTASAAWYSTGGTWQYRKAITVTNQVASPLSGYQVKLTLDTAALYSAGKMKVDGSDLRFSETDGTTNIPYWIESGINTSSTIIWIKTDLDSSQTKTIYMYYGNGGASAAADGNNVFELFDNFESGISGWTIDSGATFVASTDTSVSGSYSGKYSTSTSWDKALKSWTPGEAFVTEANVRSTVINKQSYVRIGGTDIAYGAATEFAEDGYAKYYDGSFHSLAAYTANTWYKWKWDVHSDTQKFNFWIDGTQLVTNGNFQGAISDVSNINISALNSAGYVYIDNVFVRKYAATEPTSSTGNEVNTSLWLSSYSYRKPLTVTNQVASALSGYQVKLTIDTAALYSAGKMKIDDSDLRFADVNGVDIPYWIESGINTTSTIIWIKTDLASSQAKTVYMYYGNSGASAVSNGNSVFDFFDDFSGSSIDASKWTGAGTTVSTSVATVISSGANNSLNSINPVVTEGKAARIKLKSAHIGIGSLYEQLIFSVNGIGAHYTGYVHADSRYGGKYFHNLGGTFYAGPNLTGWSAGVWHVQDFAKSGTAIYKVDDANQQTDSANYASGNANISFSTDNNGARLDVDWAAVRKYAATEPALSSWGSEQGLALTTWQYRKAITIDYTKVYADLTNFPVLINLTTDTGLAAHAQTTGNDIIFTSSGTNWNTGTTSDKLSHEIETYTSATGSLQAWVKIPALSHTQNTTIYMYYGNANAGALNTAAVWDDGGANNFKAVYHLKETGSGSASDYKDSTGYANNGGQAANEPTVNASGRIGKAESFNGTNNSVNVTSLSDITNNYTVESWIYLTAPGSWAGVRRAPLVAGASGAYFESPISGAAGGDTSIQRVMLGGCNGIQNGPFSSTVVPLNSWVHLVVTVDSSNVWHAYFNGVQDATTATFQATIQGANIFIGSGAARPFQGSLDEFRISNTVRSAGWITTEYNNQSSPSTFYSLGTEEAPLSQWQYRKAITIDYTKVGADLTNFPVLINLATDTNLAAHSQTTGNDILFTPSATAWNTGYAGDKLSHEIESYSSSNGSLQAWVKIPNLSHTQNTIIYMYYGNANIGNQQNKTAVWDSNYKGVWHMKEDPSGTAPQIIDSTSNSSSGTSQGSMASNQLINGKIGKALSFDNSNDYINLPSGASVKGQSTVTITQWAKFNSFTDGKTTYYESVGAPSAGNTRIGITENIDGSLYGRRRDTDASSGSNTGNSQILSTGTWYYVALTVNSSVMKLYVNGVLVGSDATARGSFANTSPGDPIGIGAYTYSGSQRYLDGYVDESRLAFTVRTPEWIGTEYANQNSPSTFYALGNEESYGQADHFILNGSASQTAGATQTLTLTATSTLGTTRTDYTGTKTVTFSGANSIGANQPYFVDKNSANVPFGTGGPIDFSNGTATVTVKLYKAENAHIDISDGVSTSSGNPAYGLNVTVSPEVLNNFLLTLPASANSGEPFSATITARDIYGNATTNVSGDTTPSVNQSGTVLPAAINASEFTDDGVWSSSNNLTILSIVENPTVTLTATNGAITNAATLSVLGLPQAPTSAAASRNSDTQFTLSWQDNSSVETGYKIERKTDTGSGFGAYTEIGSVLANATSFVDNSTNNPTDPPSSDKRYQYRVKAYNAIGSSSYAEDSVIHYTTPDMPSNILGTYLNETSFSVAYTDQANVENTHHLQRCSNANCDTSNFETDLGTNESSPYADSTGIVSDSRYRWQVRAETSDSLNSSYAASGYEFTTPSAPTIGIPITSGNQISVNWTDNSRYEDGFRVEVSTDGGAYTEITPGANTVSSNTNTYAFTASTNHSYKFRIRAHIANTSTNAELLSPYSSESEAAYSVPNAPTIGAASLSGNQITINWTDSSQYEDGFRVEVSTDGSAYTEITPGVNTVSTGTNAYTFTTQPDRNYKFRVRAHIPATANNSELFSAYSADSNTVYTSSSTPTIQTPTVNSSTSITWNWIDNSSFEESFRLHFTSGSGTNMNDLPANTDSYTTSNLTPNTRYAAHIHSYRSDTGESNASSSSASVYTFANAPSELALTPSADNVTATWNNNSNPTSTEYYIENVTDSTNSGWITESSFIFNSLKCGTAYTLRVKARNNNSIETSFTPDSTVSTQSCSSGIIPGMDNPPQSPIITSDNPQGVFKVEINSGDRYTKSPLVRLALLAGADTDRMSISDTPDFKNASITPYQKTIDWNIDAAGTNRDGIYAVYAKFYTKYGTASQVVDDTIILDSTAPTLNLSNLRDNYLTTDSITLRGTTEPDAKVIYNLDSSKAGVIDTNSDGKFVLVLGTLSAGTHSLQLAARDSVGNSGDTRQIFLTVQKSDTTQPPTVTTPSVNPASPVPAPVSSTPGTGTTVPAVAPPHITATPAAPTVPTQPGINAPTTTAPMHNLPTNNPSIDTGSVTPATPVSMQGDWNLLALRPLPKDMSNGDIQMIIEKFPEFKETFKELGITDFTEADQLKNVSLNLPGLTQVIGLNPTNLSTTDFPDSSTPIANLSPSLKKGIPENTIFIKTKEGGIDVNSSLTFENDNASQKISLLSGKSFQLILRPDQPVNTIRGYITFKDLKTALEGSDQKNNGILSKLASIFQPNHAEFVYADDAPVEERLTLSEFDYQDDDKDGIWTADVTVPQVSGDYELINVLDYQDIKLGSKAIRLITVVDPEGYVYEKTGNKETRIPESVVSIYWFNSETKDYELWDADKYQQKNPQVTNERGTYSFLVPPGSYYLKVETAGYATYQGDPFDVTVGSGVHTNIELIPVYDWKDNLTWQNVLLVVFGISIFYNFYRDRKLRRKLKVKEIV